VAQPDGSSAVLRACDDIETDAAEHDQDDDENDDLTIHAVQS
jgi:hypothetical protein